MGELSKTLPSGEECTLIEDNGQWTVDMWQADGEHRWSKTFDKHEQGEAEYNRWT